MCGFLTSSILIDEVNNYTGVILRIACFDLNCPLFTCLDLWHRLSSIQNQSDRLIVYFLRVSNTKISEDNSECLIGKSHIEFDLTYSLP